MGHEEFATTRKRGGVHHALGQLVGRWTGTARTWFTPGALADEAPYKGTFRAVLDGRFLLHEYESKLQGQKMTGLALLGYDLAERKYVMAWVDTCHTGTALMVSEGPGEPARPFSVLGSYFAGAGSPRWGWRTEVDLLRARLVITHFNRTPRGEEAKAVEIRLRRAGAARRGKA